MKGPDVSSNILLALQLEESDAQVKLSCSCMHGGGCVQTLPADWTSQLYSVLLFLESRCMMFCKTLFFHLHHSIEGFKL